MLGEVAWMKLVCDQILAPEFRGYRHARGEPKPVPPAKFQELEPARAVHLRDCQCGRVDPQSVRMQGRGHAAQRAERGAARELFKERLEAGFELGHARRF